MAGASAFDWDDANISHIARHRVTREEVEQEFASNRVLVMAVQKRGGEERVLCAGLTGMGRAIQFVYTLRRGRIRIITAHTAKKRLRDKL
jgi:uncharacterized DUF497 family protein